MNKTIVLPKSAAFAEHLLRDAELLLYLYYVLPYV